MPKLQERKTQLRFETADEIRYKRAYRPIMVEVHPSFVVLNLKGTQQKLSISWEGIYITAADILARRLKAERMKKRLEREKLKGKK